MKHQNHPSVFRPRFWPDQAFLYLTVTLTGAAVMMIELLGTRIIGPFYGVSLYVWSALISVTLIALAIGYFLGGFFADHRTGFRFSHAIALGALPTMMIPAIAASVLEASDGLGIRAGAFTAALVLFGPSLICLAMAGPFVIKLCSQRHDAVGTTAGTVFAISTVGSVAGTLLLGFYLLPTFGSRTIVYALGIGLWLLATLVSFHEIRRLRMPARPTLITMSVILITTAIVTSVSWANDGGNKRLRLLFEQESLYGRVRVVDDIYDELRWMLADSSVISGMDLRTGESVLAYQYVAKHLPLLRPEAETALLIGLGGGQMVRELERQGVRTDVVEIDPVVSAAARRYFDFKPKGRLWLGDGRYVVRKIDSRYDLIIHDCFTGGSEPTHLLSLEMLKTLHEHLKPGGILALNMVGFVRPPG